MSLQQQRVRVGLVADLPEQIAVDVAGLSVVVVRDGDDFFALRNNCTHQDFPLLGGEISGGRISCRKHGAKFELSTGKAKSLPAVKPVKLYRTEIEDGVLYVSVL